MPAKAFPIPFNNPKNPYDAIVVGGGHNGLVTACYLQAQGLRTLVLEARSLVGGACVTEEVFPGYRVSTTSYVCSLLRPKIIEDLELFRFGLDFIERDPSSFSPFPDGRYLLFWADRNKTLKEIAKFSKKDAACYGEYETLLERLARFVEPLLMNPPPNPLSNSVEDLLQLAKLGLKARHLKNDVYEKVRILSMSVLDFLNRWFESEQLKTTLATDGIIGAFAAPSTPGTAYVLLHHVMGETFGRRGVWAYVRGGMGGITQALAKSFEAKGGVIQTGAPVKQILVKNHIATGVVLEDGTEISSKLVVSNADPKRTFLKLLTPSDLDPTFRTQVENIRYRSAVYKLNLALSGVPSWKALPNKNGAPGPQHRGTVHISPTLDYLEKAFEDAKQGRPSEAPVLECTMASVLDASLAPAGKHLMSVFVQYAPYDLASGRQWSTEGQLFANRCIDTIEEYAPGFKNTVEGVHFLTPVDLERQYGLTGGNIFHGEMSLDQLFFMRPLPQYARYRTPIGNLYMCGSGTHPGGGVMGACGYNAAHEILKDYKKLRWKKKPSSLAEVPSESSAPSGFQLH